MKIIDLTHKIDETTLNFRGNIGCQFKTIWDYEQCTSKTKFKVQSIDISCGLGTHIDSPAHCFQNKKRVSEIAREFIYETVIIDCRNYCKESLGISFQNIKIYIEQNNLSIKNKFIILKTGWSSKWGTKEYYNNYQVPHIADPKETAEYFLKENIVGVGIDTLSPDKISFDSDGYFPMHEMLLSQDVFIIENIGNLEKINQNECTCIIAPLNIITTESPIRLIALLEDTKL